MDILSKLPERLNELMLERGINPPKLAEILNINYSTINRYIEGKRVPKYENLVALVEYFDCSADFLLGLCEYPKKERQTFKRVQPFSAQLRKVIQACGTTQYALQKKTRISTANFNDWNHGYSNPRSDNLVKLALALDCSVDQLLGRED